MSYYINYLTHSGIKGQKWGIRRFRNYDDTLTPEGKERYGYGKSGKKRSARKEEKEQRRRAEILSDPKKLYKHRSEFTEEEIRAANSKFVEAQKTKALITQAKLDQMEAKLNQIRMSTEWKKEQIAVKQAKQALSSKKAEAKRAADKAKKDEKANKWTNRGKKYKGMWDTGKNVKNITDDMGWTKADTGESIFGWVSDALGLKKYTNPPKGDGKKKNQKKDQQRNEDEDDDD